MTAAFGNQEGRVRVRVLTGPACGTRLELDLLSHREPAYFYGTYESAVLRTLGSIIKPN